MTDRPRHWRRQWEIVQSRRPVLQHRTVGERLRVAPGTGSTRRRHGRAHRHGHAAAPQAADARAYSAAELKAAVLAKLTYAVGKIPDVASPRDWFLAVAFATRDIVVDRWIESLNGVYADGRKRVYYLSLEFLIGRLLFDALDQSRPRRADGGGARRARRRSRRTCAGSSRTRRSATAASAASPPASWRAWRRWPSPPTATASATTTASSAR